MTYARLVRLLAIIVIVAGFSASRLSLFAQSPGQARQYDPVYDASPASLPGAPDEGDWGDIPAYVSTVSGDARLDRDGDDTSDFEQVPLQVGDQIRTTRGRVEILYNDGSVVALDEYSSVTVASNSNWRLHTGRIKVVSRNNAFAVDAAPVGIARLRYDGDYRVTLAVNGRSEPEIEVAVTRGSAELENALGRTLVRQGTRALTTERFAPSVPYAFAEPNDDFERWTDSLDGDRYGVTSARYLPTELRAYGGDFDRYGYWSHHHSHGWVWYPRVSIGWQPFHSGRWSFVVGFGYNWIGGSRWEWPTHHYGRWDRWGSNWFWIPSRSVVQWRRVGYSAPRRSFNVSVNYYVRPYSGRNPQYYRATTPDRSRVITAPRTDDRRRSEDLRTPPESQQRTAIPRSAVNQPPRSVPSTRPSTTVFPSERRPERSPQIENRPTENRSPGGVFQRRQPSASEPRPTENRSSGSVFQRNDRRESPQVSRPDREPPAARTTPQFGRPDTSARERRPSEASSESMRGPSRPAPSAEPQRPSRNAPAAGVGRLPDPSPRTSAPSGSRTPSSSSRPSGSAIRRGGGGGN